MLNQSLASDGHGISDQMWGSLKADLPYCQTMTFKYCNVPSSSSTSVKLGCESTNVQAFPSKSPCKGYGQKTPKQKFDYHLCQEHSSGRQALSHWEDFVPCTCSSTQYYTTDSCQWTWKDSGQLHQPKAQKYSDISGCCKKIGGFKAKGESWQLQLKSSGMGHKHWQRYSQSHLCSVIFPDQVILWKEQHNTVTDVLPFSFYSKSLTNKSFLAQDMVSTGEGIIFITIKSHYLLLNDI